MISANVEAIYGIVLYPIQALGFRFVAAEGCSSFLLFSLILLFDFACVFTFGC